MIILTVICVWLCLPLSAAEPSGGMSFSADKLYKSTVPFEKAPLTVEAVIYLPSSFVGRGGVILSNYTGENVDTFCFEIYNRGEPRLYWRGSDGIKSVVFEDVDLCNGQWTHIAVTRDEATMTASCYVNGVLVKTIGISDGFCGEDSYSNVFCIGGDHRENNDRCFKGEISSVKVYSDVRSGSEIASDYTGVLDTSDLIAAYDLNSLRTDGEYSIIEDLSPNGYDICYPQKPPTVTESSTENKDDKPVGTGAEDTKPNTTTEKVDAPTETLGETTKAEATTSKTSTDKLPQTTSGADEQLSTVPETAPQGSSSQQTSVPEQSSVYESTKGEVKHIGKNKIEPYAVVVLVFCASLILTVLLLVFIALKKKK